MSKSTYIFGTDIEMTGKTDYFGKQYSSLSEIQKDLIKSIDKHLDDVINQGKYEQFKSFYYNSTVLKFDKESGNRTDIIIPAMELAFKKLFDKLLQIDKDVKLLKKATRKLNKDFGFNIQYKPTG